MVKKRTFRKGGFTYGGRRYKVRTFRKGKFKGEQYIIMAKRKKKRR